MSFDDSYEMPTDADEYETVSDEDLVPMDDAANEFEESELTEQAPMEIEDDVIAAKQAWDGPEVVSGEYTEVAAEDDVQAIEIAEPFVGRWNQLISTTNWDKGRIIGDWRAAAVEAGAAASTYSDEAWARRVGGVTAPHVGRLRRVFDRFGSTYETYSGIYWTHFLAALDWDDAPLWLEGASRESWSVSQMRETRWQAHGAVESQRPTTSQIVDVDLDEDITLPAQGGGRTKKYDDDPSGVATGPRSEPPDFGDEEPLTTFDPSKPAGPRFDDEKDEPAKPIVTPFANLPELPPDLSDAVESFKLAVLRHKSSGWEKVSAETVNRYLDAIAILLMA